MGPHGDNASSGTATGSMISLYQTSVTVSMGDLAPDQALFVSAVALGCLATG